MYMYIHIYIYIYIIALILIDIKGLLLSGRLIQHASMMAAAASRLNFWQVASTHPRNPEGVAPRSCRRHGYKTMALCGALRGLRRISVGRRRASKRYPKHVPWVTLCGGAREDTSISKEPKFMANAPLIFGWRPFVWVLWRSRQFRFRSGHCVCR